MQLGRRVGISSKAEPITDPKILSNAAARALALCSIFALLARVPVPRDVTTTTKTCFRISGLIKRSTA